MLGWGGGREGALKQGVLGWYTAFPLPFVPVLTGFGCFCNEMVSGARGTGAWGMLRRDLLVPPAAGAGLPCAAWCCGASPSHFIPPLFKFICCHLYFILSNVGASWKTQQNIVPLP